MASIKKLKAMIDDMEMACRRLRKMVDELGVKLGCEDEKEILSPACEARIRAIPLDQLKKTSAASVTELFKKWEESEGAYNLEVSEDGKVGEWGVEGFLSIGKSADICAVEVDGVVYASYLI